MIKKDRVKQSVQDFLNKDVTIIIPKTIIKRKKKEKDINQVLKKNEIEQSESKLIDIQEQNYGKYSICNSCPYRNYSWDYSWGKKTQSDKERYIRYY